MPADAAAFTDPPQALADLRARLQATVAAKGYRRLDEPIELSSGQRSRDFIDCKAALAHGADLAQGCRALLALAAVRQVGFDAIGGMTMGADQFAHGVAVLAGCRWFVVRKTSKGRGTNQRVEGAALAGLRVLLVEDVTTTGASLRDASQAVAEQGGAVVLATAVVDRGDATAGVFAAEGVPYEPLLTYRDFDIEPVTAPRV